MKVRAGLLVTAAMFAMAADLPSRPGIDAPERARAGPSAVGVRTVRLVHRGQVDPIASKAADRLVLKDRPLRLVIWYPAARGGRPAPYSASLPSERPGASTRFHIASMAVPDAPPQGSRLPVVIVSHGYSNDPVMMSWLTENLASKGYVVVAIAHGDPPITDPTRFAEPLLNRPLDVAFVAHAIRKGLLGGLVDPARIALVGYSIGGYGVLTAAGARLDAKGAAGAQLPPGLLDRYAPGGQEAGAMAAGDIKAAVAIAPAGGAPLDLWGTDGLAHVHAPLLMIAGDADRTVGFEKGPAALFAAATGVSREMLVFRGGGHSVGLDPAPPEMRSRLWDLDWFEDPVWRKDRMNAISLHFITAFLDWHLKGDAASARYFHVATERSDDAAWKGPETPYDAVSEGGDNPAWKGFERNHQNGLVLRHLDATTRE